MDTNGRYKSGIVNTPFSHKRGTHHRTNDETQRRRRAASRAAREQLLHGVARLEACRGAFLSPGDGTPFRIDEPLLEDVVEDVLEVEEVRGIGDVDKLRGHLFAHVHDTWWYVIQSSDEAR